MPRRALLIDLDGVIRRWPANDAALEKRFSLPSGAIRLAAFEPTLRQEAITGRITDTEWRTNIAHALQQRFPNARATEAVAAWSQSVGQVDRATLEVVRQARTIATLVLLTNATSRLHDDLAALGLTAEFDLVVNSAVAGVAKPDAAIYRYALESATIQPEYAIVVDDKAENTHAAESLGIPAHLFRSAPELASQLRAIWD